MWSRSSFYYIYILSANKNCLKHSSVVLVVGECEEYIIFQTSPVHATDPVNQRKINICLHFNFPPDYNHRTHPGGDAGLAALTLRLLVAADPLAPHHVLEVGLPVAEEVDEHGLLHGGEGDLDGGPGEVAGVIGHGGPLHLLLGPVRPGVLLLMSRVASHGDVELPQDPGEEQGGHADQEGLHLTLHYKLLSITANVLS